MEKVYLFEYNYIIDLLGRNGKGMGEKNPREIDRIEIDKKGRYNKKETEVE